jgi:HEAT repeat protein
VSFVTRISWAVATFVVLLPVGPAYSQEDVPEEGNIDVLIQRLQSNDPKTQKEALASFSNCGRKVWPAALALAHVVETSTPENKKTALGILAESEPEASPARPAINKALNDPDPAVRRKAALCALKTGVGDRETANRLLSVALRERPGADDRLDDFWEIGNISVRARGLEAALLATAEDEGEEESIRSRAAFDLGQLWADPGHRVVPALRKLLRKGSHSVRVQAARALWQLDEPAEGLVPTLAEIFARYKPSPDRTPLDDLFWDHELPVRRAGDLIKEIGPEAKAALPTLIAALDNPRPVVRIAAVTALGGIGAEATPAIERLGKSLRETTAFSMPMAHHDYCVSDEAATALQRIGLASGGTLILALNDKDERVRLNAAKALGELPDPRGQSAAALTKLLDDHEPWIRGTAVVALGKLGSETAFRALASRLNDGGAWTSFPSAAGGIGTSHTVGDQILEALANNGHDPKTIVPAIVASLAATREIRPAMVDTLRRFGPSAMLAAPLLASRLKDRKQRLSAAVALARISPKHPGLFEILRDGIRDETTVDAARGLGDLGARAKSTLPLLHARLQQPGLWPAEQAVFEAAIVRIDRTNPQAVIALARTLQEESSIFRSPGRDESAATWAALGSDAKPAVSMLVDGLRYHTSSKRQSFFDASEEEAAKRLQSAELLIQVRTEIPKAIDALIDLTHNGGCDHRGMAADVLGDLGPAAAKAVPALVALLSDDENYGLGGDFHGNGATWYFPGDRAALALAKIGAPGVPVLARALKKSDPLSRRHAAEALGLIGPAARQAAPDLIAALNDPNRAVRAAAAESLGTINAAGEPTVAALSHNLADKQRLVRVAAAKSLGRFGAAAKQAVPEFSRLRNDPYESVRDAAHEALQKIGI